MQALGNNSNQWTFPFNSNSIMSLETLCEGILPLRKLYPVSPTVTFLLNYNFKWKFYQRIYLLHFLTLHSF